MRVASSKSPAVRFFTIHGFDDRPDILGGDDEDAVREPLQKSAAVIVV
jgi:hypothetical protein